MLDGTVGCVEREENPMTETNDRTTPCWRPAWIAAAVGSLLAGSLLVAGLAPTGAAGAHPVEVGDRPTMERSERDRGDGERAGRRADGRVRPHWHHRVHFVGLVTEFLDLDRRTLVEALRGGATLADLAGDRTDDLVAELVAASTGRIERAVDDGRLDRERADELLSRVEDRAAARVHGERPGRAGSSGPGIGPWSGLGGPKAGRGASVR